VSPYTGTYEWFSGGGNMLTRSLSRTLSGVAAGSSLEFWTWFDIEQDWDYGYVEASSNGTTWEKLTQVPASTLPVGITNLFGSSAWDGPGGLTGNSGGWQLAQFDLTGFSGNVQIRFRYNTDEAVNGAGWYIDDIAVAPNFSDPVDSAVGWTNPDGWLFTTGLQKNDWTADVFMTWGKGNKANQSLTALVGVDATTFDVTKWFAAKSFSNGRVYGIIGNRPDGGFAALGRLTLTK
jgi:bacillopeptidase F (M6 metalloprotease family)